MDRTLSVLMVGDAILSAIALYMAHLVRFRTFPAVEVSPGEWTRLLIFISIIVLSSFVIDLYNSDRENSRKILVKIIGVLTVSFVLLSTVFYILNVNILGRGLLLIALGVFGACQFLWHLVFRRKGLIPGVAENVLVVGTGPLASNIGSIVASAAGARRLAGYVRCSDETAVVPREQVIDSGPDLLDAAIKEKADKIVISLSERRGIFPLQDVLRCKLNGINVVDAPTFYEQATGKLLIENINPSWFIFSEGFRRRAITGLCKEVLDRLLAIAGCILAIPLAVVVAAVVRLDSPGPILFRQTRVGRGERNFTLYKFRTMRVDAEADSGAVWASENDPRITRTGKFLRKSRLDEIPQLYNIFRGDMSFIGPRPERPEFVQKLKEIIPYYAERHLVKPGLTGYAQVKYPYGASVEDAVEKLRYDLYYIKNLSPLLDMYIFLETTKVVLFGRGGR